MSLKMFPLSALLGRYRWFGFDAFDPGTEILGRLTYMLLFILRLRASHEQYGIDAAVHLAIILDVEVSDKERHLRGERDRKSIQLFAHICPILPCRLLLPFPVHW